MFLFRPSISRTNSLYELPGPILSLRIQDAFDFAKWKAPHVRGDFVAGHTPSGVDLAIEGQIGSHNGNLFITEEQMFGALEQLRVAVHSTSPDDRYRFFLYYDPGTQTYRSFTNCSTVRFEYDLSKKQLFTYTLVIHACDPTILQTAP